MVRASVKFEYHWSNLVWGDPFKFKRIRLKFHEKCKTSEASCQSNNNLFSFNSQSDNVLSENEWYFICLGLEEDN